ncbi:hypothetical protein LSTR_LSTR004466 [Laodelphax striatellus]|nr:hypothetical protein LSTR_LSTR004466 [Laodelphax striatellus]
MDIEIEDCDSVSEDEPVSELKTRKRKTTGRLKDASKRIRNQTLTTGDPCNCKRFKCFEVISAEERDVIIKELN